MADNYAEFYNTLMSKPLIPFSWLPASWGLKGQARDEAEAHYLYTGYDLDVRLAEIRLKGKELERGLVDVDHAYGLLTDEERIRKLLRIELSGVDLEVELIKLDMEEGKVEPRVGEKQIAGLLNEPWVSIIDEGLDLTAGPNGFYFVFDWNEQWIDMLRQHGYEGENDELLMEKWFTDVCRNEVVQSAPLPFNSSVIYE